ncbi:hypothetical protein EDB89DRAFT_1952349 [Lactarius sanguifluus]|nr:hypothetical protein EDB89DRAFT_1952349 [Lactarius sanguifluus]
MELLSAAQKYEMSSVLAHMRLCLAQRDPPFIHKDNAFRAYSLAQKYGLRQEAVNAAQLTLRFVLTFRDLDGILEGKLDIMPGTYLHELWTFHERFRTCVRTDLQGFRNSSASSMKAWVQHVKGSTGCPYCGGIFSEDVRTVWRGIDTIVRSSLEKVSMVNPDCPVKPNHLTILGGETHSRAHIDSHTTPLSLPECMDVSHADVLIRSSDHVDFRVHKAILATSSPVFNDMFSLAQPSNNEAVNGLPIVQLSDDAELVRALITALYPIPFEIPASYDRILALLAAAQKYDMGTVQSSIRSEVSRRKLSTLKGTQVFRTYAIASNSMLIPEMDMAARLSLGLPMTFEDLGVELRLFEGWALRALVKFRLVYMDNLTSCFRSFLDTSTGHSKIWVACPGPKPHRSIYFHRLIESSSRNPPQFDEAKNWLETSDPLTPQDMTRDGAGTQSLPAWLHDVFREELGGRYRALERPLVGPSDIRAKYMSALQKHVTTDKCTFCPGVHALRGEKYIAELEHVTVLFLICSQTTLEFS